MFRGVSKIWDGFESSKKLVKTFMLYACEKFRAYYSITTFSWNLRYVQARCRAQLKLRNSRKDTWMKEWALEV